MEAFTDKPLDELELEDVRLARNKVKFPLKLDISVFCQLTGRLPHEEIEFKEEDFIIHFYHTFMAVSIKLLGKMVRSRTNVLYHLLKKIYKEPNADLFSFMKGNSHQQTEEDIKFVFNHLGCIYSPVQLEKVVCSADEVINYDSISMSFLSNKMSPNGEILLFSCMILR